MRTYRLEGVVTALSSITHNGGDIQGNMARLRREKFVQPNNKIVEVPIVSGNAVRGILRNVSMYHMLTKLGYGINSDGTVVGLPLKTFYFLFSGGSLTSGGDRLAIDTYRKLKTVIPIVSVFGGAAGNSILPGKMNCGKLYPIAKETLHLIPEKFHGENVPSVWDLCQIETYTRQDDAKNDKLLPMLSPPSATGSIIAFEEPKQQMIYNVETLAAGTRFYWQIVLQDVTDLEFEAFLTTLIYYSQYAFVGGKSAIGLGKIKIHFDKWIEIDSTAHLKGTEVDFPILSKYEAYLSEKADDIKKMLIEIAQ